MAKALELTFREGADRVLLAVACGRTVTVQQLAAIVCMSVDAARDQLLALEEGGLVTRVRVMGRANRHLWFLTTAGATAVGLVSSMQVRAPKAAEVRSVLQAHATAVTDAVVSLLQSARDVGDVCGPTWQIEEVIRYGQRRSEQLRVDALVPYAIAADRGTLNLNLALELDRGTETVEALAAKLGAYARASVYTPPGSAEELWRERWPRFPRVCIVLASSRRADRADAQAERLALQRRLASTANRILADPQAKLALHEGTLSAAICTLPDLAERGVHQPILHVLHPERVREPETLREFCTPRPQGSTPNRPQGHLFGE